MLDNWTNAEKKIARRVFNDALQRELAEVMQTFKAKAANAREPDDLWAIEEFLTQSRHAIDKKYDFRYSQLGFVFGRLLEEGRISSNDLAGLSEDKIYFIERFAER